MICKLCKVKTKKKITNLPQFTHNEFKTLKKNGKIYYCKNCEIIFNNKKKIGNFFKKKKYFLNNKISHKIILNNNSTLKREEIIFRLIAKKIGKKKLKNILDIGCGNANLLKLFHKSKKFNRCKFYGVDKNKYFKKYFNRKNFKFNEDLYKIKNKFDVIVLVHSIFYLDNLVEDFKKILNLLETNGMLIVVIDDLNKNPFHFLMGDQKVIFTRVGALNFFNYFNVNCKINKSKLLERDIIFNIQKNNKNINKKVNIKSIKPIFAKLIKIKQKVKKMNNKNYHIFGTNINAATIDEFLNKKTISFLDENKDKIGKKFRGKKISNPKNLKKEENIIISIYNNRSIIKKIKNKYNGNFFII